MATSNATKLVAGTLLGAAAGASAGVLLAPKSGKKTRAELQNKINATTHKGKDAIATSKGKIMHLKNKAKGQARKTRQQIADKAEEIETKSRAKL